MTREEAYAALGLEPGASQAQIRSAFRQAAFWAHPDKNPGNRVAESTFRRVAEAYRLLRDEGSGRRTGSRGGGHATDERTAAERATADRAAAERAAADRAAAERAAAEWAAAAQAAAEWAAAERAAAERAAAERAESAAAERNAAAARAAAERAAAERAAAKRAAAERAAAERAAAERAAAERRARALRRKRGIVLAALVVGGLAAVMLPRISSTRHVATGRGDAPVPIVPASSEVRSPSTARVPNAAPEQRAGAVTASVNEGQILAALGGDAESCVQYARLGTRDGRELVVVANHSGKGRCGSDGCTTYVLRQRPSGAFDVIETLSGGREIKVTREFTSTWPDLLVTEPLIDGEAKAPSDRRVVHRIHRFSLGRYEPVKYGRRFACCSVVGAAAPALGGGTGRRFGACGPIGPPTERKSRSGQEGPGCLADADFSCGDGYIPGDVPLEAIALREAKRGPSPRTPAMPEAATPAARAASDRVVRRNVDPRPREP